MSLSLQLQEPNFIVQLSAMTWVVCIDGAQEGKRGKEKLRGPLTSAPWGVILPSKHFISSTSLHPLLKSCSPNGATSLPQNPSFVLSPLDPPSSQCCICCFISTHRRHLWEVSLFSSVLTLVNSSLLLSVAPTTP